VLLIKEADRTFSHLPLKMQSPNFFMNRQIF